MTNRICLGLLPDSSYGLIVSKPGYDVLTTGQENMILDSRLGFSQVHATGTIFIAAGIPGGDTAYFTSIGSNAPIAEFRSTEGGILYPLGLDSAQFTTSCTTSSVTVYRASTSFNDHYIKWFLIKA